MYTINNNQNTTTTMLNLMNLSNSINPLELYQPQVQTTMNNEGKYEVFLKAAKGREDQYQGTIPAYLLCNPYKYDLKIKGTPIDENVNVELLDRETKQDPEKNVSKKKKTVSVASIEKLGNREIVIRFSLNLCSFHYKKRDFLLRITSKSTGKLLFLSTPFHTYARKRRTNRKKKNEPAKKRKLVSIEKNEGILKPSLPVLKKPRYSAPPSLPPLSPVKVIVPQTKITKTPSPLNFEEFLFEDKCFANTPTMIKNVQPTNAKRQNNFFSLDDLDDNNDLFTNFDILEKSSPVNVPVEQSTTLPLSPNVFSPSISSPTLLPDFVVAGQNKGILEQLESQQRTSLAIQLMNQLSPDERQKVSMYMSCNNNPQHV